MIEHAPWVGSRFASEGIRGQRLGIVGYSHWTDADYADFTIDCMRHVISGEWNIAFFNSIAGYFGRTPADFYERVVMFEFVPCAIGGGDARYATATVEQAERGRSRMLQIAEAHRIEKLLIFSAKGWRASPPTIEERAGEENRQLGSTAFRFGHYDVAGRRVSAVGLRHPQYAPKAKMIEAVETSMRLGDVSADEG